MKTVEIHGSFEDALEDTRQRLRARAERAPRAWPSGLVEKDEGRGR